MDNAALPSARTASVSGMGRWARVTGTGAAVALALCLATACTPEPAPTPTPTGFASADEAFAAAEATYRAYTESLNETRTNPAHVPAPETFLTGPALTDSIEGSQQLSAMGVHLAGASKILATRLDDWSATHVTMSVCMDIANVRVLDAAGNDVTPDSRGDRGTLRVGFVYSLGAPLISSSEVGDLEC